MKQRILSLSVLFCLILSLAACGGGGDGQGSTPMTEEEYQSKVEEMSTDVSMAMTSLSGLSFTDETSAREGIEAIRDMVTPFRDFAAISNPPESYAEAHTKIAEGCTLFADSLEDMCDSAIQFLDGEISSEEYTEATNNLSTSLTEAAALLAEGFSMTV